jgi:hypothetical protein
MRIAIPAVALVVTIAMRAGPAFGQSSSADARSGRAYKLLPADEDWTFLADPTERGDFWDPIKYIPLRTDAPGWYVSIGGQLRETWERIVNDNWGLQPFDNHYINQRYMLHVDAHYGEHVRTFVDFKSGLNTGRIGGPRPIDEKKLDFAAAFLELGTGPGQNSASVRVGRQELRYGSGRLVDVREGPNVRSSFNGFIVKERLGNWGIDEIAVRPVSDSPGYFDDASIHGEKFWGIYATHRLSHDFGIDLYYLGLSRENAVFERGVGHETRHSIGTRLFRPVARCAPAWDFDFEVVEQFGTFAASPIEAWTFASDTGYRIPTMAFKPRFSMKVDTSSGDTPGSKTMGSFDPLFPTGSFFGVLATTGPGPINFIDVHPKVELDLTNRVHWFVDWMFMWRENINDGVYAIPGFLIQKANGSQARHIGDRPGTELRWEATRHLWYAADLGIFRAGRFLKEAGPGKDLDYSALYVGYKF